MKIVFLDAGTMFDTPNMHILKKHGQVVFYEHTTEAQTIERCHDAHVLITNKVVINKQVMDSCPNLKLICIAATGTNNIDLEQAKAKNIAVKNAVGYSTTSVAQLTFAVMLQLACHLPYYDHYVKSKKYVENQFFTHVAKPFFELSGKNLGIVGLGNIGREVAKIATAFGMKVFYSSISGFNHDEMYEKTDLDTLFSISDFVSIHSPLNEKTKNLVTYPLLKKMKATAYLINMGRGGIVAEADLVKILNENSIAGAATDVYEKEPISPDSPFYMLADHSKVVLTPHIAWASIEARSRLVEIISNNISSTFETTSS